MPAVTSNEEETKEEKISEEMWAALKRHIIRERQRKKEEHEAEVEEERLRKEKEARERQDVMTLGETREQIKHFETKLSQLKEQKHQLFLQLKKVLNEDDNRKKQQNKDSNEMLANINGLVPVDNMIQAQIIVPQKVSQGSPIITRPINAHIHNKGVSGGIKRGRSPSPTYAAMDSGYLHNHHHKQSHPQHPQGPTHKTEDRSRDVNRAVLWNKPSQYSSGGGGSFYPVPTQGEQRAPPLIYTGSLYQHVQHHIPTKQVVMNLDSQGSEYSRQAPPPGAASLSSQRLLPGQVQVQVHPSVGPPLQHSNVQNPKPGSITSGYPVRQQNPSLQNSNLYPSRHRY